MEEIKTSELLIGEGILDWNRFERVSDRYGAIGLRKSVTDDRQVKLTKYDGFGILHVKIIETRETAHIGDFFRGVSPTVPKMEEKFVLGRGNIFYYTKVYDGDEYDYVGVKPDDTSKSDWLNIDKLYHCHNQTVKAYFSRVSDILPQITIDEDMAP